MVITGLSSGGENDFSYIETSHHNGILETVWPFCAPTVTCFSYSPVECVCNTLCYLSVWYSDWEPIYRHYPSSRACSWIQTLRLSPTGTAFQIAEPMFLNLKPLRRHRILLWKAALCNSLFVLLGSALSFNKWTSAAPTHPACRSVTCWSEHGHTVTPMWEKKKNPKKTVKWMWKCRAILPQMNGKHMAARSEIHYHNVHVSFLWPHASLGISPY